MFRFIRERARRRVRQEPFPDRWRNTLESAVPHYDGLTHEERRSLWGHVQVLIAEKRFEGCNGLHLTDDMNVTIAGNAGLLMLHRDFDYFPRLGSVLVYPTEFVTNQREHTDWGLVVEEESVHSGESWSIGAVVLSWREIQRDMARKGPRNVVLHEFAHQVDQEDGASDGWPRGLDKALQTQWYDVMRREYEALCQRVDQGRNTMLDPYGATNPAEFFAVVTETFFMAPHALRQHHPELYDLFRSFYRQDPRRESPSEDKESAENNPSK